jgi:hypothetical protein
VECMRADVLAAINGIISQTQPGQPTLRWPA